MRVTAQLALSQVKMNRKRTIGTVFAIVIATALLTSVMCFATSGMKMMTDFLGAGYAGYGGAYKFLIVIPVALFGLLIAFMSVTVISNIFRASTDKRMKELGILKCVGGTKKQIVETVIFEGLWLGLIGIPIGLVAGTLLGYIGVLFTGNYVERINELAKSIIMRPFSFSLSFSVSPYTFLFSGVFSLIIVLWSANKPAKRVGKITALECVRGNGNRNGDFWKRAGKRSGPVEKFLGYEGTLGYRNIMRSRDSYRPTIRALALGILLILMIGSLARQAREIKDWMTPKSRDIDVDYCSIRDEGVNEETGRVDNRIVVPIDCETYDEITNRLSEYGNLDVYGVGSNMEAYRVKLDEEYVTEELTEVPGYCDERGEAEFEIVTVDRKHYEELCDMIGISYGGNILINDYSYNKNGEIKEIVPYKDNIKEAVLVDAQGVVTTLKIDGIIYGSQLPEGRFSPMLPSTMRVIVPGEEARYFDWYCSPDDETEYISYARSVMDEYYPILTEDSYVQQGYTVRISREDTMAMVLNVAIILAEIVLYGFILLLIVMGFASVISTISSNISIREREFAILKSVGMTNKDLKKMVYSESIICIFKAACAGILGGIVFPYLINLSVRRVFPVKYEIPWGTMLFSVAFVLLVALIITKIEIKKSEKQNIIETIRME